MADLTPINESPIVQAIYEHYVQKFGDELGRTYLGASVIGRECPRELWYSFRWAGRKVFEGRMYRLFQTGHLAENRFIGDLRGIGAEVHAFDITTGKQFGFSSLGGHMRGHMDACAANIPGGGKKWHAAEFKTHGSKSFATLKRDGVEKAKPEHFIQLQWYMGKTGMERGLYLAVNKDTDEIYAERVRFDAVLFAKIEAKAEGIIFSGTPPSKLSEDPTWWKCKFCDHQAVCHGHVTPPVSCRTCVHSTPERDGDARWSCDTTPGSTIPVGIQRTGCPVHLPLPFLVTYAEAIDAGDGWIEFKRKDNGACFVVAVEGVTHPYPHFPVYTTHEISAAADHRAIADPGVDALRTQFDGRIVA